jgi:citrate synthase
MEKRNYSEITPQIKKLAAVCKSDGFITPDLYEKYKVNRGLRDLKGKGVLTGLTEISEIEAKKIVDGEEVPCHGRLFYRGYDVKDLVGGVVKDDRFGFEEISYLLLFGSLPTETELAEFKGILADYRSLPNSFVRDIIMKAPSSDMMNALARSVLTLYAYDKNPDDVSVPNVLRQCL